MVRIRELKVFRPTFIMLQLLLALVVIVGFASAQDVSHQDQAEQDGLENDDTEIAMPNQFGQNNVTKEEGKNATAVAEDTQAMIAIGAALAIGIAGIGSATGIGIAGAAGIGATAEKPERFGKSLVLQAMPMTQGIYGLLIVRWLAGRWRWRCRIPEQTIHWFDSYRDWFSSRLDWHLSHWSGHHCKR
jgi:F0F1-type ATP synthase membrane subunit c/vacuolar-type H+-ATPase subunit K